MQLPRPEKPCRPPLWAKSGYLQSALGNYLPKPKLTQPWRREEIHLPDGDRLVARVYAPKEGSAPPNRKTVICVFHGLGGTATVRTCSGWSIWGRRAAARSFPSIIAAADRDADWPKASTTAVSPVTCPPCLPPCAKSNQTQRSSGSAFP